MMSALTARLSANETLAAPGPHGLAAVTMVLKWTDGFVQHEDEMHFQRYSVFCESGRLPGGLAEHIAALHEGETLKTSVDAGAVTDSWDPSSEIEVPLSALDPDFRAGLQIDARPGRFYPRGYFHDCDDLEREQSAPARILNLAGRRMQVDLNHPLSRYRLELHLRMDKVLRSVEINGGQTNDSLGELLQSPGLKARLPAGEYTDFGASGKGLCRMDSRPDAEFYQLSRLVQHLDARALETVNAIYRLLIPANADVLDLMASHDSHLRNTSPSSLHVLGMNRDELEANEMATTAIVKDLNQQAVIPLAGASVDAVICTASVEYLTDPMAVCNEVLRVLRPGGVFILTFSNRWFPSKAIHVWSELHEYERAGLVAQWLDMSGFTALQTFSSRGWPRPEGDSYRAKILLSDPLHAVWGKKPSA